MILSSGTEHCKFSHGSLSDLHISQYCYCPLGLETPNLEFLKVKEDFAGIVQELDNK